jgi:hypothetical protein
MLTRNKLAESENGTSYIVIEALKFGKITILEKPKAIPPKSIHVQEKARGGFF